MTFQVTYLDVLVLEFDNEESHSEVRTFTSQYGSLGRIGDTANMLSD